MQYGYGCYYGYSSMTSYTNSGMIAYDTRDNIVGKGGGTGFGSPPHATANMGYLARVGSETFIKYGGGTIMRCPGCEPLRADVMSLLPIILPIEALIRNTHA